MSNIYRSSSSSTGTNSLTQTAGPGVVWNLTSLQVSFAGPTVGPNCRLTIYDGTAATGTVIYAASLTGPTGSTGTIQDVPLPRDAHDRPCLQASPGGVMTIVVSGYGANRCDINARFSDGLP